MNPDIAIIGGGPAGLQTAIYCASEGFSTVVVEKDKIGGQIRQTPLLENFAGQPAQGVSGPRFVGKMKRQALAMGAEFFSGDVNHLSVGGGVYGRNGRDTFAILPRVCIIASGAQWRALDEDSAGYLYRGPYASMREKQSGGRYVVIGGGNSAGQCIMQLAPIAKKITVLVRSGLRRMSQYLVDRIMGQAHISVVQGEVGSVSARSLITQDGRKIPFDKGYFCGGTVPNASFANSKIKRDSSGFVIVGKNKFSLQTTLDNVFAIGDVRSGVWRRSVGNAIADSNEVMAEIFRFLDTHTERRSSAD